MIKLLIRVAIIVGALYFSIEKIEGVSLITESEMYLSSFIILAVIFVIVEILIYPILKFITFPIRVLSLGLASIALSFFVIYSISYIYEPFVIESIFAAAILCVVMGLVRSLTD